ncbi:MAG: FliA/WhiG family RNA polymerase sigma factor [Firmicutes bacterium HGW-Firmicutes-12]|jgi:RNA polymerase sigma factor for flagellar operon FliA|nr:MAG: FliA/WhiG family RNA polymerase sigma factor [Firmicutes bacterium HGW-Firmicutes-12]
MGGEAQKLWKDYVEQRSVEVKEELIVYYISLVQKIANKISYQLPDHYSKDDLFSYGIFGLMEAIERFNPDLGIPFQSYASKRIKGSMVDGIRKEDWVPATTRKRAKLVEQAYQKLENDTENNVSDEDVAAELSISSEEFRSWLNNIQYITVMSLDEPVSEDESSFVKDIVTDELSPNPVVSIEEQELKKMLAKAIGDLPEKEKTVVSLFYYNDLSNKEIAKVMELSDSRVSQLHTKAIFRLRGKLARQKKLL